MYAVYDLLSSLLLCFPSQARRNVSSSQRFLCSNYCSFSLMQGVAAYFTHKYLAIKGREILSAADLFVFSCDPHVLLTSKSYYIQFFAIHA